MPELPEVNTYKLYFEETALQKTIAGVTVSDDHIIRNMSGHEFAAVLTGRSFLVAHRHGKYLFGELDDGNAVLFHFGMTGDFKFYNDLSQSPKYERFVFHFAADGNLGFDCPRKFARILYLTDPKQYIEELQLGPDALQITYQQFQQLCKNKKGTLKGFLLNQKYIAGIGNLYADEICYQARVHPASSVHNLKPKQLKIVFQSIKDILQKAVERKPYYKEYPADWFWKWRVEGRPGPAGNGKVEKTKIAGRTTYFCKEWQKEY